MDKELRKCTFMELKVQKEFSENTEQKGLLRLPHQLYLQMRELKPRA